MLIVPAIIQNFGFAHSHAAQCRTGFHWAVSLKSGFKKLGKNGTNFQGCPHHCSLVPIRFRRVSSVGVPKVARSSAKMNEKHSIMPVSPFDITSKLLGPYVFSSTSQETLGEKITSRIILSCPFLSR